MSLMAWLGLCECLRELATAEEEEASADQSHQDR